MLLFQTILVPLDGSSRAEAALPIAARIARSTGATLVLVRVLSFASESWPAIMTTNPLLAEAVVETNRAEAMGYLERITTSPELAGISLQVRIPHGPVAPAILDTAAAFKSDLIVLCRYGATGLTRWMMGSVAKNIVWHASVPVLVLSEGGTHLGSSPADVAQPLRMLVPLDGSATANAALEPGASLLAALAAPGQKRTLHLVSVVQPSRAVDAGSAGELSHNRELAHAKQFLHRTTELIQHGSLAPAIAQHRIPVTWSVLLDMDVAGALLRVVEQGEDTEGAGAFGGCHLLAMATHGRAGFQRWVMGSITERVLSATQRPILIVHPPQEQAKPEQESQTATTLMMS